MGLDVYVGSLTRYYAGNWETILQQLARDGSLPYRVQIVRPAALSRNFFQRLMDALRPRGEAVAARKVRRWQDRLRKDLGLNDLAWNEDPTCEYFTDKPAWDCYGALVLWAAYDEIPNAERRETAEGWHEDSAYLTARVNPGSRYRHLLAETELWVPVDFPEPLRTTSITGRGVVVGSSHRLLRELKQLNARTWSADQGQISDWRRDGAEFGAPLEKSARLAFSIFHELATHSVQRRLPMKLDY